MPFLTVVLVRTALAWLAVGSLAGGLLLAAKGMALPSSVARLFHVHTEALLLGWMVQLAMGVAWWILPRYPKLPERGPEAPIWAVWVLLNAGVLLAGVGRSAGGSDAWVAAGRAAELAAALLFAATAAPRVKAFGK